MCVCGGGGQIEWCVWGGGGRLSGVCGDMGECGCAGGGGGEHVCPKRLCVGVE